MFDFSNFPVSSRQVGGVSPKIVVYGTGCEYLLKFPKIKHAVARYDHVSEYLASSISRLLGYTVQDVFLGVYCGREIVACKLFDYQLITFTGFGDSTLSYQELNYDLDNLLTIPFSINKFGISKDFFIQYVYSVFCLDMFLCNFDRHENNWGFHKVNGLYYPAGLYDMGASLFPKLITSCKDINLSELRHMLEFDSRCAIKVNGKKKAYTEIFRTHENSLLTSTMKQLLTKYSTIDIREYLTEVAQFNKAYASYVMFVETLLNAQAERLWKLCRDC